MSSYVQWYNANESRDYPFKEGASLVSAGGMRLPTNLIVDMSLLVPDGYAENVYCPYIKITPNIISLGVASAGAGLFMATFARSAIVPYVAYQLDTLIPGLGGWVVFGSYVAKSNELYRFSGYEASAIDSKVLHIVEVPPVTKIIKLGEPTSRYLAKVVNLVAGSDVKIYKHETAPNVIVVELTNSASFIGPCNPRIDITGDRVSLHSINKVRPTDDGIITIRFDG